MHNVFIKGAKAKEGERRERRGIEKKKKVKI
jgi:hypothetical protein